MRVFFLFMGLVITLGTAPTPLLILKAPRSGSSWFISLLNRFSGIYIREEVVALAEKKNADITVEAYVAKSLQQPMRKYPGGEDLMQQNKSFAIVGSSLTPLVGSIDPDVIKRLVPNINVVAYLRTNKVKHVVSWIRGHRLYKKCLTPVVTGNCTLDGKTTVTEERFDYDLNAVINLDRNILRFARTLTGNKGFRIVWYEDVLNSEDEIHYLLEWLGFHISSFEMDDKNIGRCSRNCKKNTSDDLRNAIKNYEAVESLINTKYPCLSEQFYERRPGKVQPSVNNLCGINFMSKAYTFSHND